MLEQQKILDHWREAVRTPITKKGSSKFRPTAFDSTALKALGKLFLPHLVSSLNVSGSYQFAYRHSRSKLDTLVNLTHLISFTLENNRNKGVAIRFIDENDSSNCVDRHKVISFLSHFLCETLPCFASDRSSPHSTIICQS